MKSKNNMENISVFFGPSAAPEVVVFFKITIAYNGNTNFEFQVFFKSDKILVVKFVNISRDTAAISCMLIVSAFRTKVVEQ